MGQNTVKIQFGGKQVDATPIDVNQAAEKWNEYLLEDGSVLKMKLVLKKVYRIEGQYDMEGNPIYAMQSTNVSSTTSPSELKRKPPTA